MGQSILSVRIDENLKKEFDEFCAQVGLNSSVAVNLFVRTVLREKRIPFEISTRPSAGAASVIRSADRDLERGRLKEYEDADELLKDLLK